MASRRIRTDALIQVTTVGVLALSMLQPGTGWPAVQAAPGGESAAVSLPVQLDGVTVYLAVGADQASARAALERTEKILRDLHGRNDLTGRLGLKERDGIGILLLDGVEVLLVRRDNSPRPDQSPLANALLLRERLIQSAEDLRQWGEDELLLRLLLGIVYPFSLLVVFRLVRTGLLRWERGWRRPAIRWFEGVGVRRGYPMAEGRARSLVRFLLGLERLAVYATVVVIYSFVWFALFPQTRTLATGLLDRIIGPAFEFIGFTARSVLLLIYTAVVALAAVLLNRYLAGKRHQADHRGPLADPVVYFPLRTGIWLAAIFLTLFPYPGIPRIVAVGILFLALLACVLAMRPLAEEVAAGVYVNAAYGLKKGDRLTIDGDTYIIRETGLVHIHLEQGEKDHWLPYLRILKSALNVGKGGVK